MRTGTWKRGNERHLFEVLRAILYQKFSLGREVI